MNSPKKSVPSTLAKRLFGDLLNECVYGHKNIVITRHDKPVAVLVRMEEWRNRQKDVGKKKRQDVEPEFKSPLIRRMVEMKRRAQAERPIEKLKPGYAADAVTLIRTIRNEEPHAQND